MTASVMKGLSVQYFWGRGPTRWGPRADGMEAEGQAVFIIFKAPSMKQVKWIFFGRLKSDLKNTYFEKHL